MKVIIDTSVLIAFSLGNEKAISVFAKIEQGQYTMFVSNEILYEYKNVLRLRKFKFTKEYQSLILEKVNQFAKLITPDKIIKFSRDRDDSPFLSIAEYIKADYLFTEDKILLKAQHKVSAKIIDLSKVV